MGMVPCVTRLPFVTSITRTRRSYHRTRRWIWRFAWTTLVGSAPLCAAVVYLGNRLDSLSPTDPGLLVAVGAFVLLLVGGRALTRRVRRREPA